MSWVGRVDVVGGGAWCVLACESDSTGVDAVLSRHRLHSVDTMETVVVQFGVGSWPEAESGPF